MNTTPTKNLSIKFVGTNRPAETVSIQPGTSVQDVLRTIGLGDGGFTLTNPTKPDQVFNASSNLYALVEDGEMLAVSSGVDAGQDEAA